MGCRDRNAGFIYVSRAYVTPSIWAWRELIFAGIWDWRAVVPAALCSSGEQRSREGRLSRMKGVESEVASDKSSLKWFQMIKILKIGNSPWKNGGVAWFTYVQASNSREHGNSSIWISRGSAFSASPNQDFPTKVTQKFGRQFTMDDSQSRLECRDFWYFLMNASAKQQERLGPKEWSSTSDRRLPKKLKSIVRFLWEIWWD